ncbi:MAG: ATP-binding protein [Pyrinomonadaceae bacterium]|nr:ATP-binding protein [Pyrinomonadaceae bacterium]
MSDEAANNWTEANQRYLMARVRMVRLALMRHAGSVRAQESEKGNQTDAKKEFEEQAYHESIADSLVEETSRELDEAAKALPAPSALDHLCAALSLSPFERDVLLLCAGMELDGSFAALCASAQGDARRSFPTFSLALAALPEAHWNALTPAASLRRWRLIEIAQSAGDTLAQSPLRIDERVLHHLAGVSYLDERLRGLIEPSNTATHELPPSQRVLAERIADFWANKKDNSAWPITLLCGSDQVGKRAVAAHACGALGLRLHVMNAADVPQAVAEREALARLWEREAVLLGSALMLVQDEQEITHAAVSFIENLRGMLFVSAREPLKMRTRQSFRVDVQKPSTAEQQLLWQDTLGPAAQELNGELERLVSQFSLGTEGIRAASRQACDSVALDGEDALSGRLLWDACRELARPRLDGLAQRIVPAACWNDLVLPEQQLRALRDIAAHVRQRARVYETWGFASKGERGLGISALFAGASGTGKTMAAEVLANDLRLDLYRIDLSQVVSKYIGETEKNLRRVFDAAEEGGAVLLFDEADALFGKRSEVKDSHDRYANIEVSYLLQRMEAYRGLAILTTNLKSSVDTAFLRRLRFIIQFPFPDTAQRAEIWRRIFPADTPTNGLDVNRLARLSIAGGNIRNIALHAAFLAADAGEPVTMSHLLRAARGEYGKLEKPLTESEIGGWL